MDEMQRAAANSGVDRASADPTLDELPVRDHPVLPLGERSDRLIRQLPFQVVSAVFVIA
jgi:hypothetical protein